MYIVLQHRGDQAKHFSLVVTLQGAAVNIFSSAESKGRRFVRSLSWSTQTYRQTAHKSIGLSHYTWGVSLFVLHVMK